MTMTIITMIIARAVSSSPLDELLFDDPTVLLATVGALVATGDPVVRGGGGAVGVAVGASEVGTAVGRAVGASVVGCVVGWSVSVQLLAIPRRFQSSWPSHSKTDDPTSGGLHPIGSVVPTEKVSLDDTDGTTKSAKDAANARSAVPVQNSGQCGMSAPAGRVNH